MNRLILSSLVLIVAGAVNNAVAQPWFGDEELSEKDRVVQELMDRIRREKFDTVLPTVMRKHGIDMWIQVLRESNPEFIREDLGGHSGVYIFTDRGGDRIERAVLGRVPDAVRENGAYDILAPQEDMSEGPGSAETELDRRFRGVGAFVAERDPKRIAVNYLENLGLPIGNQSPNQSDGISYTDYVRLTEELGKQYASRIVSAEHLIFDYVSSRIDSEFELMAIIRQEVMDTLEAALAKIVPGATQRKELGLQASLLNHMGPSQAKVNSVRDYFEYKFRPGDLIMLADGREGYTYRPEWKYGNFYETDTIYAYLLKDGEKTLPSELKKLWAQTLEIRKIMEDNIRLGQTGGESLEILIEKVEEAGYIYINTQDYNPDLDPEKTQVAIDLHAIGKGRNAPRISPLGPDWGRDVPLPHGHQFVFEYFVFMPSPEGGEDGLLFMQTHDGAYLTEKGIEYYYTPVTDIRLIPSQ